MRYRFACVVCKSIIIIVLNLTALEEVLISSWTQLPDENRGETGKRFTRSPSQELSAHLAAQGLKNALIEKGLQCIGQAHSSLLWAVHEDAGQKPEQAVADCATEVRQSRVLLIMEARTKELLYFALARSYCGLVVFFVL